ncbi:MAG: hypothetical protein COA90_09155 [Gammaproteobacteria bacterium]|nr:MAG: hypothetical protein COA90_09155 [Gammaproteobacteria bacterium]
MNSSQYSTNRFAITCVLFSSMMWGIIWYPLRLLDMAGMPGVWSSLIMYLAAAVMTLPFLLKRGIFPSAIRNDLLLLAFSAGITNVAFVIALIEGEVMRVMLLFYLSPLWAVLLGRWCLGEKLSTQAMIMLCVAMSGSVVMLWNPEMGWPWPHGLADWLALMAGFSFSVNNLQARKLASVDMRTKTGVIWWGVTIISAIVILAQQSSIPDVSIQVWAGAWLLGCLGIVVMTVAVLYGVARMPLYQSSVIMLFELIVAAIAAWWLTDEVMTLYEWLGGGLILVAAYGVARSERNKG